MQSGRSPSPENLRDEKNEVSKCGSKHFLAVEAKHTAIGNNLLTVFDVLLFSFSRFFASLFFVRRKNHPCAVCG
jgi:hypothetical protein